MSFGKFKSTPNNAFHNEDEIEVEVLHFLGQTRKVNISYDSENESWKYINYTVAICVHENEVIELPIEQLGTRISDE